MLISYRDSKRYPSDPLALEAWVRLAELAARQVHVRAFDAVAFARALGLCRRLTGKQGPEGIGRIIHACAAAGVAVVVVPAVERCRASWPPGGFLHATAIWIVKKRRREKGWGQTLCFP